MSINFDALPQENPFALPSPGVYKATITEAEMRAPKNDPSKPDYLSLKLSLTDARGRGCGSIYDILSESDSSVVQYKLARFIRACKMQLTGSMELCDLAKLVKGKQIAVDVCHDKKSDQPRAQVDLFAREAYYMVEEFPEVYALLHPDEATAAAESNSFRNENEFHGDAAERPFNAPDGGALVGGTEY